MEDSGINVEIEQTDENHEKNESIEPLEDSGVIETHAVDNCQERQIDTSSLYEEIIKGLIKWDSRKGYPESKLVQNIEKCDEEDLGEMFSMTSSQFAGKFVEFAVLARGDSLRKFENFMKGTEYKRILNEEHLRKMRLKWR